MEKGLRRRGERDKWPWTLTCDKAERHRRTMTLVGWSDADYKGQSTDGKCRLGCVLGLMSSTLKGLCRILQWTSTFTREMVKSSLRGEVRTHTGMAGHMLLLQEYYEPFDGLNPGAVGLEDC